MKLAIQKSKIHGKGLFTLEDIPWGYRVIEYTGQIIKRKEGNRREKYYDSIGYTLLFELDDKRDVDGLIGGNESIYINHSSKPNLGVLRENSKIFFYSLDDIEKGTELTFDYGSHP